MAVRYLILKHLSLGYGVLLKREASDVGHVFFADTKSTKQVLLSHLKITEALLSRVVSKISGRKMSAEVYVYAYRQHRHPP